jgi:phosphate-selective porin OprO/OprP
MNKSPRKKFKFGCKFVVYCAWFSLSFSSTIFSAEVSPQEISQLKQRLTILENQIKENNQNNLTLSLKGGPSFKTLDGNNSFALDGRIQVDAGGIVKDKTSAARNTISMRRIWLGTSGTIDHDWEYRMLVGFENNQTSIADVFITYRGFKNLDVKIGNFFENNGLDVSTPNLFSTFMERSSGITTFRPLRRTGVSFDPYGKNWGMHLGVFGSGTNNSSTTNSKGEGLSGRAHITPINEEGHWLHLGFNGTYHTPDSSNNSVRFSSTGDSNVINAVLIDTNNIFGVKNYYQYMPEFRYQKGSFTVTSEYVKTMINRNTANNLQFNGGYFMLSYFLTGEKYGYDSKFGLPTRPKISGKGAWELAGRYSFTDLNNKDIQGGKINSYDLGLNYHVNDHVKFMANYIISHLDNSAIYNKSTPQYLMLRAQLDF